MDDAASAGRWHLWIDHQPRPGWANMSLDTALLDLAERDGNGWLRLYQWEPHCLSFGRHEPASQTYDVDQIHALGLDTVRRPTGGRAVWHARELTYSIAAPRQRFGSLRQAYLEIHRLLGGALASLGVTTSLAPRARTPGLDSGACFSAPVGGEVLANGRKVIGSAQLRQGSAFLQHGSILLAGDQQLVASLTRNLPGTRTSSRDVPLWSTPMPAGEVAGRIAECAASQWTGAWEELEDPASILRAAEAHTPRFQSSSWTWAR